ncbi:MAG: CHRD domain-containing protein [Candidatus Nitrosopolaris sp.]
MSTKINRIIIFSTSAATLSILVVAVTGITTILAQQFNAQLAELYPHNVFNAKLAGSNEVPPVTTAATGTATFQLLPAAGHEQVLSFELSLKNINGVMGAHIHKGKQGENGPVVADLFNTSNPTGAINGKLTAGTLTSSKLNRIPT